MIEFIECKTGGYRQRTIINAKSADITLAFAIDFNSSGEVLTKNAAGAHYMHIEYPLTKKWSKDDLKLLYNEFFGIINKLNLDQMHLKVNIAGHSIGGFSRFNIEQKNIDEFVLAILSYFNSYDEVQIVEIRSGGQTGADEAGAKAGEILNIKTIILAPRRWIYRNKNDDVYDDEAGFKKRFELN